MVPGKRAAYTATRGSETAISPGTKIGPYEVLAPLGGGGMGEVYRGRDPRLGRDIAIKVLRAGALDADDRRRFEIEARASSSLSHPNILTIHDIGEEEGSPYIVSEFLEGQTLRALIPEGGMPVRKLLDIAVQIADGLAAAHARGVVHRDLKPENVVVRHDGQVKILDFGLAKVTPRAEPGGETKTLLLTSPGAIVGTLAYLSPEQIQGDAVDFRADQFSFGVVLYEMATGMRPFQRDDRVSTLAAIVKEEPPPIAGVPAPLRWAVERCLAKDPEQRYASTADMHRDLRTIREHLSDAGAPAPAVAKRFRRGRRVAFGSALLLAAAAAGFFLAPRGRVTPYTFTPFATDSADETQPAWSPAGNAIAYVAPVNDVQQIFVRTFDSPSPARITAAPSNCLHPFWSPDGTRVYYWSAGGLWAVGATGGAPQEILRDVAPGTPPASMSPDGKTIAFFRSESGRISVYTQNLSGGTAARYHVPPFPESFRLAGGLRFAPDGKQILAYIVPALGPDIGLDIWVLPWPGGTPRRIPVDLAPGFRMMEFSWLPGSRRLTFSTELIPGAGTHIYSLDSRSGAVEPLTTGTGEERQPSVSPAGRRLAFVTGRTDDDIAEVAVSDGAAAPLLATSRNEYSPDWSPAGHQFAYVSNASGVPEIWLRNPSEGWARPVVRAAADGSLYRATPRFSPDGQRLAYVRVGASHLIWISNLSGSPAVPLERESQDQHAPAWSPDGNWIAYTRYMGQKWEIAKASSGGGGPAVRLCDGGFAGGTVDWASPEWIVFQGTDGLYAVPAAGGAVRRLQDHLAAFACERGGAHAYVARRGAGGAWELATIAIPDGTERRAIPLGVPARASVRDLRVLPDGKHLAVTVETAQRDIWILDGLK